MPLTRLAIFLLLALVACHSPEPQPFISPSHSPMMSPLSAPEPLAGPDFELSTMKAGDTVVTGSGPIGMPILIVDVSMSAEPLASVVINDSGSFQVVLSQPLPAGHLIGIQVTDLSGTTFQATDSFAAQLDAKAGPGFRYYPQIGAVYTSMLVTP